MKVFNFQNFTLAETLLRNLFGLIRLLIFYKIIALDIHVIFLFSGTMGIKFANGYKYSFMDMSTVNLNILCLLQNVVRIMIFISRTMILKTVIYFQYM